MGQVMHARQTMNRIFTFQSKSNKQALAKQKKMDGSNMFPCSYGLRVKPLSKYTELADLR